MVQFPQMSAGLAGDPVLRAQLDAQIAHLGLLTLRSVDTLQRLNDLNLGLARQLLDTGVQACRDALACDDPAQMAAAALRGLQPSGERLRVYQHALFGVVAEAQAGLPSALAMPAPPAERAAGAGRP
jgi:phasin family protein